MVPTPATRHTRSPCYREYAAGLGFAAGPFSYLALRLQRAQRPTLLWASNAIASRDRLPPGFTDASAIVPPTLSDDGQLFFYWSATAPPPAPPPAPPASPPPAPAPAQPPAAAPSADALEPLWKPDESTTALSDTAAPTRRRLLEGGTGVAPSAAPVAAGPAATPASPSPGGNTTAAVEVAAAAAEAAAAGKAVLATAVAPQTQGVGVVAPEGMVPTAV